MPEANEEDGELNGNGILWNMGVVLENVMALD
jgi:hypothetical protein